MLCDILQEQGMNKNGMDADQMRETLASHTEFKFEKSCIERFLTERGHKINMFPK